MNGWLHLWGLARICPCNQEDGDYYNTKIAKLIELDLPHEYACQACKILGAFDQEKCPYLLQKKKLNDAQKVMSPIQYSYMGMFNDFKADHVVVDDCQTQKRNNPTRETLAEYYRFVYPLIFKVEHAKLGFEEFLKDEEFDKFVRLLKDVRADSLKAIMQMTVIDPNIGKIPFFAIPAEEFEVYRKYSQKYGNKEGFATPYFFYLFDYITENTEANLTIIDAKPNEMFMADLKRRYEDENQGKSINYQWEILKANFKDLGSTIHQCLPQKDAWLPTNQSINKNSTTRIWIGEEISNILKDKGCKIGFVTTLAQQKKAEEGTCEFIKPEFHVSLEDILWYGNQRGSNNLEHCNPIFVVGTYVVNRGDLIRQFRLWFPNIDLSTTETIEQSRHGSYYHYKDSKLENFRTMFDEDELYHAILRGRPHLYKKDIYCFCLVPEEIKNDPILHFDDSFKRNRGELMDEKEEWLIQYVKEHSNHVPERVARSDMAKKFGIAEVWAYEKIRKITKNHSNLHLENGNGLTWLVWQETE